MLHRCEAKNRRSVTAENKSTFRLVKGFAFGRQLVPDATCRVLRLIAGSCPYATPRAQTNRQTLWTSRVSRCECRLPLGCAVLREWRGPDAHGFDSSLDRSEARHERPAASPKILSTNQQLMMMMIILCTQDRNESSGIKTNSERIREQLILKNKALSK